MGPTISIRPGDSAPAVRETPPLRPQARALGWSGQAGDGRHPMTYVSYLIAENANLLTIRDHDGHTPDLPVDVPPIPPRLP
jgi:hypothetical protein